MEGRRKYLLQDSKPPVNRCLGLRTDAPDYRVCWLLNQHYHLALVRSADLVINLSKKPTPQAFTCFLASDSQGNPRFRLISNQSHEGAWLTRYPQVDYLFLASSQKDPSGILSDIRERGKELFPEFLGIFDLLPDELASLL